ncbi:PEP-CTERM-box response regulator transcription factor [Plasticicumulans sp.]|uniref:PEP-CTERM-box response regulator transcription factor n=1 Tax=Plasticicumulans sp. TaxID=2307179 RepID=UPI000FC00127|nr:PEP-CTERM-box response regulator transcription factor [Plasticicumulans sp.]MBS0601458.1 PEP-CTERM-box response regulator transcription factor [Pseudomonadota bacterium]RTK97112.1 MAG: PEP-CTERM-box response regulator transcription factor [Xanthomonadales bacterium]HMV38272.1 PEP-CTERM-box response regulator transcription factor [Plasticicumulans sp.]HMW29984.1 PEP-CTERM-box response regulator transcription factor [Plasticicumulans sp.]HMW41996.1 PEP-CTERM-box response regulator transcripti
MRELNRKLLIVEDDPGLQSQLRWCFADYEVLTADSRDSAIAQLRRHEPPIVTLDLGLPPDPANATEGLATLQEILQLLPSTKVIVVTGNDDRDNALQAVAAGAYDFYQKPVDGDVLKLIVDRAHALYALENENRELAARSQSSKLEGLIAGSASMLKVCRTVEKIAPTDATSLLLGDSGTGKELIARALHDLSNRADKRFVAINCAAIPETLLESELFGYEKGAFTGAAKQTRGKIEYADGGTFFLDEVGDLPMSLQAKLLRFLQQRVIERVGGREEIPVDVRVVCATHRELPALIRAGSFREDLYYRISEITLNIPPLRERDGDTVLIARAFLERYSQKLGKSFKGYTREALTALENYAWPGNVRELENKVKRAVIMAEGSQITADDLELEEGGEPALPLNLRRVREQAERQALTRAIAYVDGNLSQAADILGITRPTLYALLNKYNMKT